jgi:hypothetical protein
MLHEYVDRKVTLYYSDGTRLLSFTGPITHYDAKGRFLKVSDNHKEILFPLSAITKIEVEQIQATAELESDMIESYEHRGHDFW